MAFPSWPVCKRCAEESVAAHRLATGRERESEGGKKEERESESEREWGRGIEREERREGE